MGATIFLGSRKTTPRSCRTFKQGKPHQTPPELLAAR
jgi:hypothetical protein